MTARLPAWVDEAMASPIAFAQVREDPLVDLAAIRAAGSRCRRMLMVASGGCTAAFLAGRMAADTLELVDVSSAQLALTRLKLRWLATATPDERLALLGHTAMAASARADRVARDARVVGVDPALFGPGAAEMGLDHAGRYERLFAALRARLLPHRPALEDLLALADPARQRRRLRGRLGQAIDRALAAVMRQGILERLFGSGATANRRQPFARHFAERTRWAIAQLPAADNPWLAQLLLGRYQRVRAPWLELGQRSRLPTVRLRHGSLLAALEADDAPLDVIHASNVLDWLPPAEAARLLDACWRRLRPGGVVIIRQLNSMLDVPACEPRLRWLPLAARLHARDRSFFYRALHLGQRPAETARRSRPR